MPKKSDPADMDFSELDAFIDALPDKRGALITVLHKAQDMYGYLPQELQKYVAFKLTIPASKVFGVVSFYSFLKTQPQGRVSISVCMGTACFVRGAESIRQEFEKQTGIATGQITNDREISLASVRCIGACGLAPVVVVGEKIFGRVKLEDVKSIVEAELTKEVSHGQVEIS